MLQMTYGEQRNLTLWRRAAWLARAGEPDPAKRKLLERVLVEINNRLPERTEEHAMSEFKQDTEVTPCLMRVSKDGDVTAVFPTLPGDSDPRTMTCYAHIGQHSACSLEWLRTTRNAKPYEYEELARELESAPFGYRLKITARYQERWTEVRRKALRPQHPVQDTRL